jgi:hypothetical protein
MKKLYIFFIFLLIFSCIEPYNFKIESPSRSLVVEALITDKSFLETVDYPSDGRYHTVKLRYTGDVVNERPTPASGASVQLHDDLGNQWAYSETTAGLYLLLDSEFKALPDRKYQLVITEQDDVYESQWEQLPTLTPAPMGEIGFTETEKDFFVMEANEWVVRTKKGIETYVTVPVNPTGESIYYRWEYEPTWVYAAPLAARTSPQGICWATSTTFLIDYALQIDNVGGYNKPLFFIPTVRNVKLFEKFSLLVKQYSLSSENYYFWKEMQDRATGVGINEVPPFNLKSNYISKTEGKQVYGYFGVGREQAKRWYFTLKDLSYFVENTLRADCLVNYGGPPAPECFDCREYSDGNATNQRPVWWVK